MPKTYTKHYLNKTWYHKKITIRKL